MDCNESRGLIEADTDGEIELVHHLELAAHLRSCPACTRRAEAVRNRTAALREGLPRFSAPPEMAGRIRAALAEGTAPIPVAASTSRTSGRNRSLWPALGMAASLAFAVLVGFSWGGVRARADRLFDEAFTSHVRSLQAGHLTDVVSTDQHTVKPWFAGKLDFSPPVTDLTEAGFPLAGGRLEEMGGRPAAALIFHRRQHTINLFIWPAGADPITARAGARDGFQATGWTRDGFNFFAVSDIPAAELAQFAEAFRTAQK